ncbi:DUF1240 domain-containing protein [Yersinia massiliensis]|uniref:DUF1240 domain-containing protein n=1 Tax=Yersinia massiliensis TaxID=419257 RepID=UPI000C144F8D|nr:DUF1240 domain-containing protein [Yersinia massiliensis]PHZ23532.1 hypothetical protein CS535_11685 [Yersinia massiliensis]
MLIIRLKAIVAFFVFFIIGLGVFYFSIQELIEYFKFHDVIIYSWMDCFSLFFSFVVFLFSIYPSHVAFYGVPIPAGKSRGIYKIVLVFFAVSLVIPIAFSFIYVSKLESKGYIQCQGTPSGWMPGMATKYVTSEALCLKKSN